MHVTRNSGSPGDTPYDISADHSAETPMKPKVSAGSLIHFGPRIGVSSSKAVPVSWSQSSGTKEEPVMPPAVAWTRRGGENAGVGTRNAQSFLLGHSLPERKSSVHDIFLQ